MAEIVINDLNPRSAYTAAGGETGYDYDFPIFDEGDLKVVEITDAGVVAELVLGTDYSVGGVGDAGGGSIVFDLTPYPSGAPADYRYVLYRDLAISRSSDFLSGGDFRATTVNRELDKIIMMLQQNERDLARKTGLQLADAGTSMDFEVEATATRAGKFVVFTAAGTGLEAGPSSVDITGAATYAAQAEAALDSFTDTYLGDHASDPATDNDGDALTEGALYFNTTTDVLKYWTGVTWSAIGANTDEASKVSANDTTAGYLNGKLVAGSGISLTENNDGSNETLTLALTGSTSFDTGDMMPTFKTTAKTGWLIMNGDTIGDAGSGADDEDASYESLFEFLWDNVADTYAAVSSGRGASAAADWAAGKTIVIPDMRGRGIVGTGQGTGLSKTWANGEGDGAETVTIAEANLPAHTHGAGSLVTASSGAHQHNLDVSDGGNAYRSGSALTGNEFDFTSGTTSATRLKTESDGAHTHTISGTSGSTGSGTATNIQNPMRAANWQIKI